MYSTHSHQRDNRPPRHPLRRPAVKLEWQHLRGMFLLKDLDAAIKHLDDGSTFPLPEVKMGEFALAT